MPVTAADAWEQPFPAARVLGALPFGVPLEHVDILAACPECGVHGACAVQEYGPQAPPLLATGAVLPGGCEAARVTVGSVLQEPAAARAPETAPGELL